MRYTALIRAATKTVVFGRFVKRYSLNVNALIRKLNRSIDIAININVDICKLEIYRGTQPKAANVFEYCFPK